VTVDDSENKEKELSFTLSVAELSDENAVKEMTFSCNTAEQVGEWEKSIVSALDEVRKNNDRMYEQFIVKIQFTEEKMGIRVEERRISVKEKKKPRESKVKKAIEVYEKTNKPKKKKKNDKNDAAMKLLEQVAEDMAEGIQEAIEKEKAEQKAILKEKGLEVIEQKDEKNDEAPCELVVININDKELNASGLKVNCVVTAINNKSLAGMRYTQQLDLLIKTAKPYTLTFTGENYLRHKPEPKHSYDSILKELTADGDNSVKRAFHELVEGTPFEEELNDSTDKSGTIEKLLSNQRRLMALLQKSDIQDIEL